MELFKQLLSPDFMPYGYCYLWDTSILRLHLISDGLITLSYYCIPIILIYFIRKNRELSFNRIFWVFGTFILACGTTHLMETWNVWYGSYVLAGATKAITAVVSVITAAMLLPLVPMMISLPSRTQLQDANRKLEQDVAARKRIEPTHTPTLSRTALGMLGPLGLPALILFSTGRKDYPDLHTILDTCMFVLAGLLALLIWDIGARGGQRFPKCVAVSFAVTSLAEFVHTLASLEQAGVFAPFAQAADVWRPATWPPAAYLLPIGISCAIWLARSRGQRVMGFALALIILAVGLFFLFHWLPRYTSPGWFGVTRPTLIFVPLLWGLVVLACRRLRASDRLFSPLALMAVVLLLANACMLYSRAPHDTQATMAHLGRVGGYLALLLSLMQMASFDMLERIRSERELAELNAELESRVLERTTQLKSANQLLESEIVVRSASEERTRLIIDTALDAVVSIDATGIITGWNAQAEAVFGWPSDDVLARSLAETIIPDRYREAHTKGMQRYLATGHATVLNQRIELVALHREGHEFPIELSITPIQTGGALAFSAFVRDITERKHAGEALVEQALELTHSQQALETQTLMLQSVLDSMAEGLVASDEHGKFLIWNRAAQRILGYGPANLPTHEWSEHYGNYLPDGVTLVPTEQLPLVRAINGETSTSEIFVRNPKGGGDGGWIEASGNPLKDRDGVVRGGVVAFRDITQRKADEREIRKLNDELEERVIQRTAQLVEVNQELEAFTYSVSHDLRAPLRHMAGFSGLLLEEFGSTLDSQGQHYVRRIQEGTRKMGQLVDELLGLARVGRQSPSLQVVGLNSMVEEVLAILKAEWDGRDVEWRIADLPSVQCDPTLMKQVFQNLLSNALKYSRPRPRAVIEVGPMQADGQFVIFVRDNGVGFNMKYRDKLFGVFQRLHRPEDFEGTGVGLATVQRIIKKHGGRVWAEGEVDKGATFYFTVELAAPTEPKSITASAGTGV